MKRAQASSSSSQPGDQSASSGAVDHPAASPPLTADAIADAFERMQHQRQKQQEEEDAKRAAAQAQANRVFILCAPLHADIARGDDC